MLLMLMNVHCPRQSLNYRFPPAIWTRKDCYLNYYCQHKPCIILLLLLRFRKCKEMSAGRAHSIVEQFLFQLHGERQRIHTINSELAGDQNLITLHFQCLFLLLLLLACCAFKREMCFLQSSLGLYSKSTSFPFCCLTTDVIGIRAASDSQNNNYMTRWTSSASQSNVNHHSPLTWLTNGMKPRQNWSQNNYIIFLSTHDDLAEPAKIPMLFSDSTCEFKYNNVIINLPTEKVTPGRFYGVESGRQCGCRCSAHRSWSSFMGVSFSLIASHASHAVLHTINPDFHFN